MCALHTAPAEAHAPDADRDAIHAPLRRPNWAIGLIALLILLMVASILTLHPRRSTSLRNAVARACRALGLAPNDDQLAKLTRAVEAVFDQESNWNHGCTRIHTDS